MEKMEADAENVTFSDTIYQLTEQLTKLETEQMKFLCADFIPMGNLESMDAPDLMLALCERRFITSENLDLLAEALILIRRLDIINMLGCKPDYIGEISSNLEKYISQSVFSGFKILIFDFAGNLTRDEVKKLVFYLETKLNFSKGKLVNCKTGLDLMTHLEKAHCIHPKDLSKLVELAQRLRRKDLIEKIQSYSASIQENDTAIQNPKPNIQFESHHMKTASIQENDTTKQNHKSNIQFESHHMKTASIQENDTTKQNHKSKPSDWRELVQCIPEEKLYSFCEDLGISKNKYKMFRNDLGKLFDRSFVNNIFNTSDLEEAIQNLNLKDQVSIEQLQPKPPAEPLTDTGQGIKLQCYKMSSQPRGKCLIINNEDFGGAMNTRNGSTVDKDAFKKVFQRFHFEVVVDENLTTEDMEKKIKEVASIDHKKFDCFVCCILSHGIEGLVYGTDGTTLSYKKLTMPFKPNNCESLTGKPKLFFIQACQGLELQQGSKYEDVESDGAVPLIPNEADFLMASCTVPGYASCRSKSKGTWFIQSLCKVFSENAKSYDVNDMLLMVNEQVSRKAGKVGSIPYKQVPGPFSTLRKKVFLLQE